MEARGLVVLPSRRAALGLNSESYTPSSIGIRRKECPGVYRRIRNFDKEVPFFMQKQFQVSREVAERCKSCKVAASQSAVLGSRWTSRWILTECEHVSANGTGICCEGDCQNLEILFLLWSCACTDCLKLNFEIPQTSRDEFRWPEEDWTC
jgi:hypothetical protein